MMTSVLFSKKKIVPFKCTAYASVHEEGAERLEESEDQEVCSKIVSIFHIQESCIHEISTI